MEDYQNPTEDYSFKPVYTADLTNRLVTNYRKNPNKFNEKLVSQLEEHANHYNIGFNRDTTSDDFNAIDTIKQVGTGFMSGFTTLNYGEPPKNPYENIAHSLGHLAGFVGWVPGAHAKSSFAALRALSVLKGKSIPLVAANAVQKPVSNFAAEMVQKGFGKRSEAVSGVAKLLYNDTARDAVEGAFHLGTASAVSSWTHGVDAMIDSAIHGGVAGGAFRGIGNLLKSPLPKDNAVAENVLGSVAGALFTGLPATMRGATAPEQVYEYLLGAYFGFNESPSSRRVAQKYRYEELQKQPTAQKMQEKLEKDLLKKDWSPETQKVVREFSEQTIQSEQVMEIMRKLGRDNPALNQALEARFVAQEGKPPTQEQIERIKDNIFKTETPVEPTELADTPRIETVKRYNKSMLRANTDKVYLFGDNLEGRGKGGQAVIRDEPNSFGIPTKKSPRRDSDAYFMDAEFEANKVAIDNAINAIPKNKIIVFPEDGLGTGLAKLPEKAPRTWEYLQQRLEGLKKEVQSENMIKEIEVKNTEQSQKVEQEKLEREDTGVVVDAPLNIKDWASDNIVKSWLKEDGTTDVFKKKANIEDLNLKLREKIKNRDMDIDELTNWMKVRYNYDITSPEATERNFFRTFLKRKIAEQNVRIVSPELEIEYKFTPKKRKGKVVKDESGNVEFYRNFQDIKDINFTELTPDNPQNIAGNRKSIKMPVFNIENIYNSIKGGNLNLSDPNQRPLRVVDEVIIKSKSGFPKETNMLGFKDQVERQVYNDNLKLKGHVAAESMAKRVSEEAYNKFIGNMYEGMRKKGYYYFSGRGDADKMMFMKYHPEIEAKKPYEIKQILNDIIRENNYDKNLINKDKSDFVKKFKDLKIADDVYNRGFVSNLYYNMSMNGITPVKGNYNFVNTKGFITNPIAFNKRAQIWFTSGYEMEPAFLQREIKDMKDGQFRMTLTKSVDDLPGELRKLPWEKMKNTDTVEHVDGGTPTRDDVMTAIHKETGMYDPSNPSGHSKNMTISIGNEGKGAMLLKDMNFDAGVKQSKAMEKLGVHFMPNTTAAKQYGNRKAMFHEFVKGEYKFFNWVKKKGKWVKEYGEPEIFDVDVRDLKTVLSETTDTKNIKNKKLVKQMQTNFSSLNKNVTPELTEQFYNDYNLKHFNGKQRYNDLLKEYEATKNPDLIESIVKNIENISTTDVARVLTEPGLEELQLRLYEKLFRINRQNELLSLEEGEIGEKEISDTIRELNQYKSTADRNLKLADNNIAVYLHKAQSPLKRNIIKNYIVGQITRPLVPNSLGGRIRPYDVELQINPATKRLNKEKDLIFLDDGAKGKKIDYEDLTAFLESRTNPIVRKSVIKQITKNDTLEKLWNYRNEAVGTKTQEYIDNFLESITTRVPIDSTSGSVVLKFGGFTGRKGFGGIVHGEVMSKIGGADTDGDKFFSYFGIKPEYKQVFRDNANEFVRYYKKSEYLKNPNKLTSKLTKEEYEALPKKEKEDWYSAISNNKNDWRHLYTITEGEAKEVRQNPSMFYSVNQRKVISDVAADGRNRLGVAVVDKQNLLAAYTDLFSAGVKSKTIEPSGYAEYDVKLRTDVKQLSEALEKLRTSIAIPSDPLDEIGIKGRSEYFSNMFDSIFEVTAYRRRNLKTKKWENKPVRQIEPWMKRYIIAPYSNINSAYYGKNYSKNRQWTYEEMKDKGSFINIIAQNGDIVSSIARQGRDLQNINFYDGLDRRLNKKSVAKVYDEYSKNIKDYYDVAKAIGKAGWQVPLNKPIRDYLGYKIENMDKKLQAEQFLSNDMHNMASFNQFIKYWKEIPTAKLTEMAKKAQEIQNKSFLSRMEDKEAIRYEVKVGKEVKELSSEEMNILKRSGEQFEVLRDIPLEKKSTIVTQAKTDKAIYDYKRTLNPKERQAFDALIISGFKPGDGKNVDKYYKLLDKKDRLTPLEEIELARLRDIVYATNSNSLGFASEAISDNVIQDFWKGFDGVYHKMSRKPSKELSEDIDNVVESVKKVETKVGEKEVKANLEEGYESKLEKLRVLDKIPGFRRLSEQKAGKVKLTNENQKLYDELLDNLNSYGNSIGIKLEGLIADLFNKSPDAMTIEDVRAFNHLLGSRRKGDNLGWIHNQFIKWTKGDPKLSGYFYHIFPRTVDKAWLKKDLDLVERIGYKWEPGKKLPVESITYKPLHAIGQMQYNNNALNQMAAHEVNKMESKIRDGLQFLNSIKEGTELHELAIYKRELPTGLALFESGEKIKATAYGVRNGRLQPKIQKRIDELSDKKYRILDGKTKKDLTGSQIMDKINKFWNKTFDDMYNNWIFGDNQSIKRFVSRDKKGVESGNIDTFIKEITDAIKEGRPVHEAVKIGVDGINKMATHTQLSLTNNPKLRNKLYNRLGEFTKYRSGFWGHRNYEKSEIEKALKSRMEELKKKNIPEEDRQQIVNEAANLALRMRNIQDEFDLSAYKSWNMFDEVTDAIKNKMVDKIQFENAEIRSGHTMGRKLHIAGYDRSPSAGEGYAKSVIENFYKNTSQILSRKIIDRFEKAKSQKYLKNGKIVDKAGYDNIQAWGNFFKLYANRALGYPEVIPDYLLNNPNMGIKGTPYYWFADSTVKNRMNIIAKKMGIKNKDIPKEIDEMLSYNKIRNWSNMEAKYQLATLLAHPKTAIANIFGGSTMTIQSVGLRNWSKVRNYEWLKNNVDSSFTSRQSIYDHVVKLGVQEDFLRKEIGLSGAAKSKKVSDGLELLAKKIKRDPSVEDKELKDIWKKSGLSDSLFEKAAYFMRKSERMLRTDSYMAHLLQGLDIFKGAINDINHPFLVWWAKEGVKNTQFLYDASNRPAFASSALGKVVSRFQIWAWNSVAFRSMVYREAKERGFQRGTKEFERFKRTMQMDLMMFSLANVFAYSLFENTLPAPLNWFQDLADWMFGDESERDRAFFGAYPKAIAPLQMVTPPALRLLPPTMKALLDDDWSRMSDYYLWTVLPFGRLARDVKISAENPMQIVERSTGLPYIKLHRYLKEQRELE
tara:strand:- start:9372 stop:18365 length:8994 start_codon:yes stop_codon:yes gene_type:complete